MWLLLLLVLAIVFIVLATTTLKLHPFLALLITAFGFGILSGNAATRCSEVGKRWLRRHHRLYRHRDTGGFDHRHVSGKIRRRLSAGHQHLASDR